MDILWVSLIKTLVLPPTANLLAIAAALVIRRRWRPTGSALFGVAFGSLVLLALPIVSTELARPLENFPPFDLAKGPQAASAIVILGGGRYADAPEYRYRDTVHSRTLTRLRYGAYLAAHLQLPIALIGGDVSGGSRAAEGMLMLDVMREDFNTPVRWVETSSRNTAENAMYARQLLSERRIILVTNALHMVRSKRMFAQAGFEVLPAPTDFTTDFGPRAYTIFAFVPTTGGLTQSHAALHEYLGIFWYHWRYHGANSESVVDYKVNHVPPTAPP
ncbi:MAG: YdcF family protein [Gammaproteobacteria bacterium]|nr:YdcF family protein [Gammaproteobacteria bacterium]